MTSLIIIRIEHLYQEPSLGSACQIPSPFPDERVSLFSGELPPSILVGRPSCGSSKAAHHSALFQLLTVITKSFQGFPGGSVVKNPSFNAGDTGSIPDPERSHMPRSN